MARTPGGSWKACPDFGLRDSLEEARRHPEFLQLAADATNRALAELGVTRYRIESIEMNPNSQPGIRRFSLFVSQPESNQFYSVEISSE